MAAHHILTRRHTHSCTAVNHETCRYQRCMGAHQNDGVSGLEVVMDLLCWRCAHAHLRLTGSEASLEPQQTPARLGTWRVVDVAICRRWKGMEGVYEVFVRRTPLL